MSEAIPFDLECIGCRYNLRGIAVSSRCPECGRAIWESMEVVAIRGRDRAAGEIRLAGRSDKFLKSIRNAAGTAILANLISLFAVTEYALAGSNLSAVSYVHIFSALALVVNVLLIGYSLWHFGESLLPRHRIAVWLFRAAPIAYSIMIAILLLGPDASFPSVNRFLRAAAPFTPTERALYAASIYVGVLGVIRLIYVHRLLRIERQQWIAGPVLASLMLGAIAIYLAVSNPSYYMSVCIFNLGGDDFLQQAWTAPTPLGAWPMLVSRSIPSLIPGFTRGFHVFDLALISIGHLLILIADSALFGMARSALARRSARADDNNA